MEVTKWLVAEAFDVTDHFRWSRECAGRNASER